MLRLLPGMKFSVAMETDRMKSFGIILIVIGIAMIIIRGVSVPTQKKVVDIGSLEIRKSENKWIGWPTYAGAIVAVVGVVLVVTGKKKG
jgi:hypothetical protein